MHLQKVTTVVGTHAEGEVGRVIGGMSCRREVKSCSNAYMVNLERGPSWLRDMLLFDLRGCVNAAVNHVTPVIREDIEFGVIVTESEYFVPTSGSKPIRTATVALETDFAPMQEPETRLRIATPAGPGCRGNGQGKRSACAGLNRR